MVSLDDVLGRTPLKRRIDELEEEREELRAEVERLEDRVDSVDDERARAETGKQEAYEERNRLQSKVEELRDRLERAEAERRDDPSTEAREVAPGDVPALLDLLDTAEAGDERLTSVYVAPGDSEPDGLLPRQIGALRDAASPTGVAGFFDDFGVVDCCLVPPRRLEETRLTHGPGFEVDRTAFTLPDAYVVAVVSADRFAAGVHRDGELHDVVSHRSDVRSKHSKGGFSQARFERLRDEQIDRHLDDAAESLADVLSDAGDRPVYLLGPTPLTSELARDLDDVHEATTDARGEGADLLGDAVEDLGSLRLYLP